MRLGSIDIDNPVEKAVSIPGTTERVFEVAVWLLTIAFFSVGAWICHAKWINHDPHFLDFAKTARYYEQFLQGVRIENQFFYYGLLYSGYHLIVGSIYAIFRSPAVIVFFHLSGFSLCIPLIYRIARGRLGSSALGFVFALGFALNPAIDMMLIGFQRVEIWCGLGLLATVYFFEIRRPRFALAAATIGSICRIDAVPAFLMLGVTLWLAKQKDESRRLIRRCALTFAVLIASIIFMRLVLGGGADTGQLHLFSDHSDGSVFKQLSSVFFDARSYSQARLLGHVAFLALLAPSWLLPCLPSFAYMVLSELRLGDMEIVRTLLTPGNVFLGQMHTHMVVVLPMLFVAAISGLRRLIGSIDASKVGSHIGRIARGIASAMLFAFFLAVHIFFATDAMGPIPLTPGFSWDRYADTPHAAVLRNVVDSLPVDRFGVLQFGISERASHLPQTREFYKINDVDARAQYLVFDLFGFSANIPKQELIMGIESALRRDDFRVTRFEDGVIVMERGSHGPENDAVLAFLSANRPEITRNGSSYDFQRERIRDE